MVGGFWKTRKLLWLIILPGIVIRSLPAFQSDFPINDGGMFLVMIQDIHAHHFLLPEITSYNFANIPFAYPPFAFYVAALIASAFPISEIDVLHWLPTIVCAMTLPAFYGLALHLYQNRTKALIAAALLAVLSGPLEWWLVMGGGLTRSFGALFLLLTAMYALRLFRDKERSSLLPAIVCASLTALSHPEDGLQVAGLCALLCALFVRDRAELKSALFLAAGVAACTAPWWLTTLARHGIDPFVSAAQTSIRETLAASLFNSFFTLQGSLPILPVFSLLGLFITLRKREFLLAGWIFLPFLLDPRNAPSIAHYAYVLLFGEGIFFLTGELKKRYLLGFGDAQRRVAHAAMIGNAAFALLCIYFFALSWRAAGTLKQFTLERPDREAMEWVRLHTPADAQFLLLTNTGQISPMVDAFQEWFPALAQRRSLNTLQGVEWTLGAGFYEYALELVRLQRCADTDCLQIWAANHDVTIEYIAARTHQASPELLHSIEANGAYRKIYSSDALTVYEHE